MKNRCLAAAVTGGALALTLAIVLATGNTHLPGRALAQQATLPEEHRMLVFALATAIGSVAVDSERNAMTMNTVADRVSALEERIAKLEKRLADLESKR